MQMQLYMLQQAISFVKRDEGRQVMTHKYRGSIIFLLISKSVKPNDEQKESISDFQQGILCKCCKIVLIDGLMER
jgi:hypothetical protein